jgi:hypothetical protein
MTARPLRGPMTAVVLSILLLAGACRDEPKIVVKKIEGRSDTTELPGGAVIEAASEGQSLAVPEDLPAFAPAYPGARLATRIGGEAVGDGRGALMVFQTADPVEKVAAFYDARAKDAGAAATVLVTEADSAVRIYGGKDQQKGAMVAISTSDEGTGSEIVITSGLPRADVVHIERKPDAWRETVRMPVRLQ